ncbi:MAG: hypothetical protein V1736_00735 [Pseudomonadota bacterium]
MHVSDNKPDGHVNERRRIESWYYFVKSGQTLDDGWRRDPNDAAVESFLQVAAGRHKGWHFEVPTVLKKSLRHVQHGAPPQCVHQFGQS